MFRLILNTKTDVHQEIGEILINEIFKPSMVQAMQDMSQLFTISNHDQLISQLPKVLSERADDKVNFFRHVLTIHLLHQAFKDLLKKEKQWEKIQGMLKDYRKRLIILMSKIFVIEWQKQLTESKESKVKDWEGFLQKTAAELLKQEKIFDKNEVIQLHFMMDKNNLQFKVDFYLFWIENIKVYADVKFQITVDESVKLIGHINKVEHKSEYMWDLLFYILQNLVFPPEQIVQLLKFIDKFYQHKIVNVLVLEIRQQIEKILSKELSGQHLDSLMEEDKEFAVFEIMQKAQRCSADNIEYFKGWQKIKLKLFELMYNRCLRTKKYEKVHDLLLKISREKTDFRYIGLEQLWSNFIKFGKPITKFKLIREYAKHGKQRIDIVIGGIYNISLTKKSKPFFYLIQLLVKFLPENLMPKFAKKLNLFVQKSCNSENYIKDFLKELDSGILDNEIFRHCVYSIALIFDYDTERPFAECFKGGYLLEKQFRVYAAFFANILIDNQKSLLELNRKVRFEKIIKSKFPDKIFGLINFLHKHNRINPVLAVDLLIKSTPAKYYNFIIRALLKNRFLGSFEVVEMIHGSLNFKENTALFVYELQVKLLQLRKYFANLIKIITRNAQLRIQDLYKKFHLFDKLNDFCLIIYGKQIKDDNTLSSKIATFDDDIGVYWDMLAHDAPTKIMLFILKKYEAKLKEFSEYFGKMASRYEVNDKDKSAFFNFISDKYLKEDLGRHDIKHQVFWILPYIINIFACNAYASEDSNKVEIGKKFIRKYYAIADKFPELNKKIKTCRKEQPDEDKDIKQLLRCVMLVILGSVHSNFSCDDLLRDIKDDKVKLFCEFNLFFDQKEQSDEKEQLAKWEKVLTMNKKVLVDRKKSNYFEKKFLQEIINALFVLCDFKEKNNVINDVFINNLGCFMYILIKCRYYFRFRNWIGIKSGDNPEILYRTNGKIQHQKIPLVGKSYFSKNEVNTRKVKTSFSRDRKYIVNYSYTKENKQFILDFYKIFFEPYYNIYSSLTPCTQLLMNYIQRCLKDLSGNIQVSSKRRINQCLLTEQWQKRFEKHKYDYYSKIGEGKFIFKVCKISRFTNHYLCDAICKYLRKKDDKNGVQKRICEIVGIELARHYCLEPHLLKRQLHKKLCEKLDKNQLQNQVSPENMPRYMKVCNGLDSVINYVENIWKNSYVKHPKMVLAFAMVHNIDMCIWKVFADSEIKILEIDKYSDKLKSMECKHTSQTPECKIEHMLCHNNEYLLLQMRSEPNNEKTKGIKLKK